VVSRTERGTGRNRFPKTIVSMSLRLAIPRRVGLHQSPLPLRQPTTSLKECGSVEKENQLNSKCANSELSQRRGSPHRAVPELCQNPIPLTTLGLLLSEKQIPQVVVNIKNGPYPMEYLEAIPIPWAQGVGRSNRPAPTKIKSLLCGKGRKIPPGGPKSASGGMPGGIFAGGRPDPLPWRVKR
jgi:hypothetical protein